MTEKILVLAAHNDDSILGAGGTLAKYSKQGKQIKTIIFSYGELSHPHLKPERIIKTRQRETIKANNILGKQETEYLGMKDTTMLLQIRKQETKNKIINIIQKEKPDKIFTHSSNDLSTHHFAIHQLIKKLIKNKKIPCPVYSFDTMNIPKIRKRGLPKLVVDITDTFQTKIDALKAHKSQNTTIKSIGWLIYLKAKINGWNNNCKYAEVFDKIN
ncbi:PIG-L family deacetylase [Candidatus Woesearchaeota archaeon]|nr:PIG-L family deacetylase [Candidatus Woesearchaeota archaeon]